MDSPIITDAPCGGHPFTGTSPEARAAVARQCEMDAGTEKVRNLVTETLSLVDRQRALCGEILLSLEQRSR